MSKSPVLTEQAFYVLTALVERPLHGYAVMQEIAEVSEGRMRPRVGALYTILDRLTTQELIAIDREEVVDGRFRRYYRLTERGRQTLSREAARQSANARAAEHRLARWPSARPSPAGGAS